MTCPGISLPGLCLAYAPTSSLTPLRPAPASQAPARSHRQPPPVAAAACVPWQLAALPRAACRVDTEPPPYPSKSKARQGHAGSRRPVQQPRAASGNGPRPLGQPAALRLSSPSSVRTSLRRLTPSSCRRLPPHACALQLPASCSCAERQPDPQPSQLHHLSSPAAGHRPGQVHYLPVPAIFRIPVSRHIEIGFNSPVKIRPKASRQQ